MNIKEKLYLVHGELYERNNNILISLDTDKKIKYNNNYVEINNCNNKESTSINLLRRLRIKQIKKILTLFYGEDFFEIKYISSNTSTITIHYPKTIIKNSFKEEHVIKDLYVSFNIKFSLSNSSTKYYIEDSIKGLKTTFTIEEYNNRYVHSHLDTGNFIRYRSFCIGSKTAISLLLNTEDYNSKEDFENFLHVLNNFISWESIEGGPYIRMSTINENKEIFKDYNYPFKQKYINLLKSKIKIPFKIINKGKHGSINIDFNDEFKNELKKIFPEDVIYDCINENGKLYKRNNITNLNEADENIKMDNPNFYFNGNLIIPKVIKSDKKDKIITEDLLHKDFLFKLNRIVSKRMNIYFLKTQ